MAMLLLNYLFLRLGFDFLRLINVDACEEGIFLIAHDGLLGLDKLYLIPFGLNLNYFLRLDELLVSDCSDCPVGWQEVNA
jgi:hypothetical protein